MCTDAALMSWPERCGLSSKLVHMLQVVQSKEARKTPREMGSRDGELITTRMLCCLLMMLCATMVHHSLLLHI